MPLFMSPCISECLNRRTKSASCFNASCSNTHFFVPHVNLPLESSSYCNACEHYCFPSILLPLELLPTINIQYYYYCPPSRQPLRLSWTWRHQLYSPRFAANVLLQQYHWVQYSCILARLSILATNLNMMKTSTISFKGALHGTSLSNATHIVDKLKIRMCIHCEQVTLCFN